MKSRLQVLKKIGRRVLRRWRPPRRIFPTRAGWVILGAPFVLGVAAINAGNNLLFLLLGACLGAIVISGLMSERALNGIRVDLKTIGRIRAGERTRVWLHVQRELFEPGDNPSFGLMVREQRNRSEAKNGNFLSAIIPRIEGASGSVLTFRTFAKRGKISLRPLELSTIYPFGLLRKSKDIDFEKSLIVRPRVVPVPEMLQIPAGRTREEGLANARGLGTELYGLREKNVYDPQNRVHARRSLALGRTVVVEMQAQERPQAWIGIVNSPQSNPEAFERTLELASETMVEWSQQGYAVGICIGKKVYSPQSYGLEMLLDEIALLQVEPDAIEPHDLNTTALWLLPKGTAPLTDSHRCCRVDANGSVARC
jgi:uncharacterized protein (DUF58 family)